MLNSKKPKNFLVDDGVLFVEFDDIIKSVSLSLSLILSKLKTPDNLLLDVDLIKSYDLTAMMEWYRFRENRNIIKELSKVKGTDENFESILSLLLNKYDIIYDCSQILKGTDLVAVALEHQICDEIVIYSDYTNNHYVKECTKMFGDNITIVGGDFEDAVRNIPYNTTYVLSDINKVDKLFELNKLNCTSILLPIDYKYNDIDNRKKILVEKIQNSPTPVKILYFSAWGLDLPKM